MIHVVWPFSTNHSESNSSPYELRSPKKAKTSEMIALETISARAHDATEDDLMETSDEDEKNQ